MEVSIIRRCQPRFIFGTLMMMLAGVLGGYMFNVVDLSGIQKMTRYMQENQNSLNMKPEALPTQPAPQIKVQIVEKIVPKIVEKTKIVEKIVYKTMAPPHVLFRFWGQFLLWDTYKRPAYGSDVAADTDKYFVYRCDKHRMHVCGGWADRLKGIVISYLLANLTDRSYKIHLSNPECELTNYLLPNRVNWSLPSLHELPKDPTTYKIYRHIDDHRFKGHMRTLDVAKKFNETSLKYFMFLANLENVSGLKKNKAYTQQLSWMKELTPADVYAAIYKRLFRLHPRLQKKLQTIMYETLKTPKHRLICVHIRMGRTKTIPSDTEVRNNVTNLPKIFKFINDHSKTDYDKIFMMSDSEGVMKTVREQPFKDRLVTIPGDIVHVDKQRNTKTEVMCSGFEKLLLEHHVLMNCDVLVRGHSGLSVMASAIRGTDKDLYCLERNGNIKPCVRNDFYTFQ